MNETSAAPAALAPQHQIASMVTAYWQSRALAAAAELELADHLSEGPLSVDVLAARTKADTLSLFRLMRALESAGIFTQVSPRVFANTPVSDCLRKDVPGSQWAWVRLVLSNDMGQYQGWTGLKDSVHTGKIAFDDIHGYNYWQFLQRNPSAWAIFNEAMRSFSAAMTPLVTTAYDWSRFPIIADIGGGMGTQLVSILDAYPSCPAAASSSTNPRLSRAQFPTIAWSALGATFLRAYRRAPTLTCCAGSFTTG